jgi:ABC-type antimicrobial peptide transport system permease subunit
VQLGVHVGDSPETLAPRVREIVTEVDPDAILGTPVVLSDVHQGDWYLMVAVAGGMGLLVVILMALAASAVYAIMSFSISERTREIGIRAALGARRSSLVYAILRRSVTQIALGAVCGMGLATVLLSDFRSPPGESRSVLSALPVALAAGVGIVVLIALFSCVAPTRRALGIEPSEALRGAD